MATEKVRFELRDGVAVVAMDDGKANALSHEMIEALHAAMDRAEKEARAFVLLGRPGRLSAGFDLTVMTSGPEAARRLAFRDTKVREREATVRLIRQTLTGDMAQLIPPRLPS